MSAIHRGTITAEEFAALPRDGLRTELVRGEIVAKPPAFTDHGETAMRLSIILGQYVLEHDLGELYIAETGFLIARNPDTICAPDLAFIQKAPRGCHSRDRSHPGNLATAHRPTSTDVG